jgi:hypothetical protein
MSEIIKSNGRLISKSDIKLINTLIKQNKDWNRTRLSKELCLIWDWRMPNGQLKDMACRSLLLKLHRLKLIHLPEPVHDGRNNIRNKVSKTSDICNDISPINTELREILPLSIKVVKDKDEALLFKTLLNNHHYLGYKGTIGEHIKYLVFDNQQRPIAALLFGSAAWRLADRDQFIGWDNQTRQRNLSYITNNMRFLILPWVKVPNLASHILSKVARRIKTDWLEKYNHPIVMLETFVEIERFKGVCYKAANWIYIGKTKGRSRNDRYSKLHVPIKDIYLLPLVANYREVLLS